MKKVIFFGIFFIMICNVWGMNYEEARQRAWFLTDKMAYELDLTEEQYNRAYEINLDYLLNIQTPQDLYGSYWTYRNEDMRCILFDWQFSLYQLRNYIYRPVLWQRNNWYLSLYDNYRSDYYYFNRPIVVNVYKGRIGVARGPRSPYSGIVIHRGKGLRENVYPHLVGNRRDGRPFPGRVNRYDVEGPHKSVRWEQNQGYNGNRTFGEEMRMRGKNNNRVDGFNRDRRPSYGDFRGNNKEKAGESSSKRSNSTMPNNARQKDNLLPRQSQNKGTSSYDKIRSSGNATTSPRLGGSKSRIH